MTDVPTPAPDEESSDLKDLSDEGVGATVGEKNTFEPEESEGTQE